MSEDTDEEAEPAVELGEGEPVEGAPLARVASRLTWPQEASRVRDKEGDATVRTPDGPRTLDSILDDVDETYFDTRQTFLSTVRSVIGTGPVPVADE
ncbi:hypothetical protein SAMN04488065_1035 [Haloplanus vescus]|uniref:Uncharacterized protein n=1 Tax=Haloplanus vescus TaxID=555874 RepID=A0A1H3WS67_9EURY|nr:DUF5789 family protein [Haloplanus vescus]SDZ89038.1 hypothetical protein SAMN04488065_1035 [Haloplanus vescus]